MTEGWTLTARKMTAAVAALTDADQLVTDSSLGVTREILLSQVTVAPGDAM